MSNTANRFDKDGVSVMLETRGRLLKVAIQSTGIHVRQSDLVSMTETTGTLVMNSKEYITPMNMHCLNNSFKNHPIFTQYVRQKYFTSLC